MADAPLPADSTSPLGAEETRRAMGDHTVAVGGAGAPQGRPGGMGGSADAGSAAAGGSTSDPAFQEEADERTGRTDQVAGGAAPDGAASDRVATDGSAADGGHLGRGGDPAEGGR